MAAPFSGLPRAGKGSRVSVNGTNLNLAEWDVDMSSDDLDTTTFESGGMEEGTVGIQVAKWDMKGRWDASKNFFDSPPALYPQDSFPNLQFYENVSDNVYWMFPFARILSSKNGATVRGLVTFEASGKSNSSFMTPTGSV